MRVKINRAGKFGTILARFGTKTFSGIYMRVEINRAGKFGTILACFGTKSFLTYTLVVDRVQNSSGSGWLADHGFGFGFIGFQTLINFRVYRVFGFEK